MHHRARVALCPSPAYVILLCVIVILAGCVSVGGPTVAVVVSDRVSAYQRVADALGERVDARVYVLNDDARKAQNVGMKLRELPGMEIVAIGSLAVRTAAALPNRLVVYCQDFHPDNRRAAGTLLYGVRAVPPAIKQLQAWKMLSPGLQHVVLVSGGGLSEFARDARYAARDVGVQLEHIEVESDRDLLYVVKRLEPKVQGLWFAPDNRVLSVEVLREVLAYGMRQGIQTLVFNRQLLELGALVSVEGDPNDIADRVLEQLSAARSSSSPRVLPLSRARVEINAEVAERLGLTVPRALQGLYVF